MPRVNAFSRQCVFLDLGDAGRAGCERSRASEQLIADDARVCRERARARARVVRAEEIRSIWRSSLATCRSSRALRSAVRMRSALLSRRGQTVRRQIILAVSRLILLGASPVGPHVHHHGVPVTRTYAREDRREPFRGLVGKNENTGGIAEQREKRWAEGREMRGTAAAAVAGRGSGGSGGREAAQGGLAQVRATPRGL